jgi:hypothetical protein
LFSFRPSEHVDHRRVEGAEMISVEMSSPRHQQCNTTSDTSHPSQRVGLDHWDSSKPISTPANSASWSARAATTGSTVSEHRSRSVVAARRRSRGR